jgi:molybdate transport system substrate-binding protein
MKAWMIVSLLRGMQWRAVLTLALAVPFALTACALPVTKSANQVQVTVYAAASLRDAFEDIGKVFETANPGVKVVFNFSGSQLLAEQIAQGAPADVFASANQPVMDAAIRSGRIDKNSPKVFAYNRLVVIVPQGNPANLHTLADLARPGLALVLASKEVPAGSYALEVLSKASASATYGAQFRDKVLANVRSYEEDVRAAVLKTMLGEADCTIAYPTDASGAQRANLRVIEIPDELNIRASYPIAPLDDSRQQQLAQKFVDYVLSPAGQTVLHKHGFIAASP